MKIRPPSASSRTGTSASSTKGKSSSAKKHGGVKSGVLGGGITKSKPTKTAKPAAPASNTPEKPLSQHPVQVGDSSTKVGKQVKYGPTADLTQAQKDRLSSHYQQPADPAKNQVLNRLTQYNDKHSTYVNAAEGSGRPLTSQELTAKKTGANAPDSSINHVIASGTGQNILNHGTLDFQHGAQKTHAGAADLKNSTPQSPQEAAAQKKVAHGLAQQAAAVGRQQGYSRATLEERHGELSKTEVGAKRNQAMKNTLTAMQGAPDQRFPAYKEVLKDTFDAPGNLRVGNGLQNTKVSTGFDAPLDAKGKPTARAERLHQAHQNYAPDRLLADNRVFTKNSQGQVMSSSMEVPTPSTGKRPASDVGGPNKRTKTE